MKPLSAISTSIISVNFLFLGSIQANADVRVGSAFSEWLDAWELEGEQRLPGADPDKDGRINLEEFAFNGNPVTGINDDKFRYVITSSEGQEGKTLTLTLPIRDGAIFEGPGALTSRPIDGIIYHIQGTVDLQNFTKEEVVETETSGAGDLPSLDEGWSYRTFALSSTAPHIGAGYLRAVAQEVPSYYLLTNGSNLTASDRQELLKNLGLTDTGRSFLSVPQTDTASYPRINADGSITLIDIQSLKGEIAISKDDLNLGSYPTNPADLPLSTATATEISKYLLANGSNLTLLDRGTLLDALGATDTGKMVFSAPDSQTLAEAVGLGTVIAELATKANLDEVAEALATKADAAQVASELATKANKDEVAEALATKADAAQVASELLTKADKDAVEASLAAKADIADLIAALANKQSALRKVAYADENAAISGGILPGELYLKTDGSIGWVTVEAEALAYQAAHGISDVALGRLNRFLRGLDDLGLRSALVDAGIYRKDSQPLGGPILWSLRGNANVTLTGTPARWEHGIYFSGAGEYGVASIPPSIGARSFVGLHAPLLGQADTRSQVIFQLRGAGLLQFSNIQTQSSLNSGQYVSYGGEATRVVNDPSWGRSPKELTVAGSVHPTVTSGLIKSAMRDDGLAGATSFSGGRLANRTSFTRGTLQGEPSHMLNQLRICVTGNSNLNTIDHTTRRVIPGWVLFNRALTDEEEVSVGTLLDKSIFPRFRFVWEGDSITNDMRQRAIGKEFWAGSNNDWYDQWEGGETTAHGIAQLGTISGLNDSNLASDIPTIAFIAFGTNDLGNPAYNSRSVEYIHGQLRTLWAYARARGAKVVANTVFQGYYITDNGREADRIALNELIRADAGVYYDLLCDRDEWAMSATPVRPVYDDTDIIRPGGVHLNLQEGMGSDRLTQILSDQLIEAGWFN